MMHSESELEASRAPFLDHLAELRIRLWWSVVAIFLSACGCFIFADFLGSVIMEPIITALKAHGQSPTLASRTVQGGFLFSFKVAIIFGVFLSIPVVLFQVWQFIAPGLYKHERRFALPFVVLSTLCFAGGGFFAYYLVLPAVFDFLIGYSVEMGQSNLRLDITIEDSLGFITKLLLAFGLVFELPVAVAFLSWIGLVTHVGLLKFWRWAVVIAFILGALLTPPDLVSQLFLAVPLVTLYGISIGIAYVLTKRRQLSDSDDDDEPEGGSDVATADDDPKEPPSPPALTDSAANWPTVDEEHDAKLLADEPTAGVPSEELNFEEAELAETQGDNRDEFIDVEVQTTETEPKVDGSSIADQTGSNVDADTAFKNRQLKMPFDDSATESVSPEADKNRLPGEGE